MSFCLAGAFHGSSFYEESIEGRIKERVVTLNSFASNMCHSEQSEESAFGEILRLVARYTHDSAQDEIYLTPSPMAWVYFVF